MTTQATRLVHVYPWGAGQRAERRRPMPRFRWRVPGSVASELAGGAFALAATLGIWGWFLAAVW